MEKTHQPAAGPPRRWPGSTAGAELIIGALEDTDDTDDTMTGISAGSIFQRQPQIVQFTLN